MIALLLSLALASEPELPTTELAALGLDTPTTSTTAPGWRAALPGGGLVRVITSTDEADAIAHFEWQQRTAQAAIWPVDATELSVDQQVGDGKASLLVRQGTVVLYVRDLSDRSAEWVERLLPIVAK